MRTPEEKKAYFRAYYQANKERYAGYHKKNYAKNKETICRRTKAWAIANPSRRAALVRKYVYGTNGLDLFVKQQGLCKICHIDLQLLPASKRHLDHCHETSKVRGWLCSECNLGLGKFGDNVEKLTRAISYLLEHQ